MRSTTTAQLTNSLLLLKLLLIAGLADVHADCVAGGYRPLKVHAKPNVVVVSGKLPEQACPIIVCRNSNLRAQSQI